MFFLNKCFMEKLIKIIKKNEKFVIFSLLFIFSLVSCETETMRLQKIEDNVEEAIGKKRIKPIGHYDGIGLYEIDGHLYGVYYRGGLTHLESCKCKKSCG